MEYIFFDMDGVILDSMPYHAKSWIETFSQFGWEFKEEEIYLYEGAFEFEVVKELFLKKGIEPKKEVFYQALSLQKRIFQEKYAHRIKPFEEVPELLALLREKGKKLALVTSSHRDVVERVLPEEIRKHFSIIVTGEDVKRRKPHPDPYLRALSLSKAPKERALVVENAPAGVSSAKNAGLYCVGITTTLPPHHLSLADLIARDHKHLKELLLNGL